MKISVVTNDLVEKRTSLDIVEEILMHSLNYGHHVRVVAHSASLGNPDHTSHPHRREFLVRHPFNLRAYLGIGSSGVHKQYMQSSVLVSRRRSRFASIEELFAERTATYHIPVLKLVLPHDAQACPRIVHAVYRMNHSLPRGQLVLVPFGSSFYLYGHRLLREDEWHEYLHVAMEWHYNSAGVSERVVDHEWAQRSIHEGAALFQLHEHKAFGHQRPAHAIAMIAHHL